jgi:hypothetical protein
LHGNGEPAAEDKTPEKAGQLIGLACKLVEQLGSQIGVEVYLRQLLMANPSLSVGRRRSSMICRSANVNVKKASISKAVSSRGSCFKPKKVDCQLSIAPSMNPVR